MLLPRRLANGLCGRGHDASPDPSPEYAATASLLDQRDATEMLAVEEQDIRKGFGDDELPIRRRLGLPFVCSRVRAGPVLPAAPSAPSSPAPALPVSAVQDRGRCPSAPSSPAPALVPERPTAAHPPRGRAEAPSGSALAAAVKRLAGGQRSRCEAACLACGGSGCGMCRARPPGVSAESAQGEEDEDLVGLVVRTPRGWGTVLQDDRALARIQVALDWCPGGRRGATVFVKRSEVLARSFCAVGRCVQTQFGSGVLVDFRREDEVHVVRVGAPRGRRSSTLYCRRDALRGVRPAAVGFAVATPLGRGVAVRVDPHGECQVAFPWGVEPVPAALLSCPAAAALPLVECVSRVAMDQLARCSSSIRGALAGGAQPFDQLLGGLRERGRQRGAAAVDDPQRVAPAVRAIAAEDDWDEGDDAHAQPVRSVQIGWTGEASGGLGVSQRVDELELRRSVQRMVDGLSFLSGPGVAAPPRRPTETAATAPPQPAAPCAPRSPLACPPGGGGAPWLDAPMDYLRGAAGRLWRGDASDLRMLRQCMQQDAALGGALSECDRLWSLWRQSDVGDAVASGTQSLTDRVGQTCHKGTPLRDRLEERAQGALSRLQGDSVASEKLRQLVIGAHQRADARLQGVDPALLTGPTLLALLSSQLRHVWRLAADGTTAGELLLGLGGAAAHGSKFGLAERLERCVACSLEDSGADLRRAGPELLERFRIAAGPGAGLPLQGIVAVLDDLGVSLPPDLHLVLDATLPLCQSRDDSDSWCRALGGSLFDPEMARRALEALGAGERLVQRVAAWQDERLGRAAAAHAERIDLEGLLLGSLRRLDPEKLLQQCDAAAEDPRAREALVQQTLDMCLELLLDALPSLSIPEVRFEHRGSSYRVLNLELSGIGLRKENVKVHLGGAARGDRADRAACAKAGRCGREALRLEAREVSAQFPNVQCFVKVPAVPEATAVASATARGITLDVVLEASSGPERPPAGAGAGAAAARALAPGRAAERGGLGLAVGAVRVGIEELQITFADGTQAVGPRLLNPFADLLAKRLKPHICESLEELAQAPLRQLCEVLNRPLLTAMPALLMLLRA